MAKKHIDAASSWLLIAGGLTLGLGLLGVDLVSKIPDAMHLNSIVLGAIGLSALYASAKKIKKN